MTIEIILISVVIFCALILNLAAKPKLTRGIAGAFTFLAAAGGLIFYGSGFTYCYPNPVLAIIRTLFCVSRMFAGVNELGAISGAPIFEIPGMLLVFWILHFMAFYATASATISTIGAQALKKLKFWLQRYGKTMLIYGTTTDTVEFGRNLMEQGARGIIFISSKCDPALENAINSMGCIYRSDSPALKPDLAFLKSIGSAKGTPSLMLYALDPDDSRNLIYARDLLNALENAGVSTDKTGLIMRSRDDQISCPLAKAEGRYGYGDVKLITDVALTARMLMQEMPPYKKMTFDSAARATGDFDAVIVGFGRSGSEVLRHLVRYAQFEGSSFHAAIFTPDGNKENGYFLSSYPGLMENYDISFRDEDARSQSFYDYLAAHSKTLRYLVICTGNEAKDRELWNNVTAFLTRQRSDCAVCRCSSRSLAWSETPDGIVEYRNVYTSDRIISDRCDRMAMHLNYSYVNDPSQTPESAWADCDFFSRESSRASADYIQAFAYMTGQSEEDIMTSGWASLTGSQKENLGKTEHLRWCAFHYSMGFTGMSRETIVERGSIFQKELAENGKASIRITKDLEHRQHACLCSWEELDTLADLEARFKGSRTDYKDMDIRNVLALPEVLKAAKKGAV